MRADLAPRQRAVLDFVASYTEQKGIAPTLREIGEALGIKSTNGVTEHLEKLIDRGLLVRVGGPRAARSVRMPDDARGGFREISTVAVPVVGSLSGEDYQGTFYLDSTVLPVNGAVFALTLVGPILHEGLFDGDMLFVRRIDVARSGELLVERCGDGARIERAIGPRSGVVGIVVGVYRRLGRAP